MRADDVGLAVVAAAEADAGLQAILGGSYIYRSGAHRELRIPSLEWFQVIVTKQENTESVLIRFDAWGRGYAQVMSIEARLRALFDHDTPRVIGGLLMFSLFQGARDLPDPEPGVAHRAVDVLFIPSREA